MNIIYILAYIVLWPAFRIFKPTRCINKKNFPEEKAHRKLHEYSTMFCKIVQQKHKRNVY